MRIILEASKARRKTGDAEPSAPAVPAVKAVAARAVAAAPAPAPAVVAGAAAVPSSAARPPAVNSASNGDAARAGPVEAAQPAQDLAKVSTSEPAAVLSSSALQSRAVSEAVPSLQAGTGPMVSSTALAQPNALPATTPAAALPAVASVPTAPLSSEVDKPRLLTMIEPELSVRLLDQLGRNATVMVDLALRADGSVASAAVIAPASRQLERALAPALERWKFAPMASARVHRVELVFNAER
jgi:hypothetical protein